MGQQQQPSTTTMEPPKYLQPYLEDIAGQAQGIYQPGLTGAEQGAIGAAQGLTAGQTGLGATEATARGDYLYGGQGFNQALDAASRRIIPQVNSQFARSGRSGSGLAQTAMAQALSDSFAGQYGQERGRQQQAAMASPGLQGQQMGNILSQAQMPQDILFGNLGRYANIINPQASMGGQQTSPMYKNSAAGGLGGSMLGYYMGGPMGMLAGGILGGLL